MDKLNPNPHARDETGSAGKKDLAIAGLSHYHKIWLAEIIRRIEASAWLDDSAVQRQVITLSEESEARILNRAILLGDERRIVTEIAAWRSHGRTAFTLFAVLAFLGGFVVAASALGDGSRTVNIIFALVTLLGIHCVTLILWGLSLVFASRAAPGLLGTLWIRLTLAMARGDYRTIMLEALVEMLRCARLLPWLIGGVSHALWCLAFLGVLGGLLFMLAFREYHFNWDTTILPAEFFITLTQTLGRIPQALGFLTPDVAMVRNTAAGVQSVWASWLVGCVVVYGLLPRAVFTVICLIHSKRGLSKLNIDPSLNYYIELKQRIQTLDGIGAIVDPDDGAQTVITTRRSNAGSGHGALLVGIEIADDMYWPRVDSGDAVKTRKVASNQERQQLLRSLSEAPVKQLLIAVNAHSSPDRGSLRLIADISAYAVQCKVWLMVQNEQGGDAERLTYWHEALRKIGLNAADIIEDEYLALRWLEQADE